MCRMPQMIMPTAGGMMALSTAQQSALQSQLGIPAATLLQLQQLQQLQQLAQLAQLAAAAGSGQVQNMSNAANGNDLAAAAYAAQIMAAAAAGRGGIYQTGQMGQMCENPNGNCGQMQMQAGCSAAAAEGAPLLTPNLMYLQALQQGACASAGGAGGLSVSLGNMNPQAVQLAVYQAAALQDRFHHS